MDVRHVGDIIRHRLAGFGAALLYGACSTSMAFINKALLTSYNFNFPFLIMTCQMLCTIFILETLHLFGRIEIPRYTLERGYGFLLPSVCYALNSALGLYALGGMNIPMYGVLKRCTPLVSLIFGWLLLKKGFPSKRVLASVILMTAGCIIAGFGDLKFNVIAYICGAASNVTQALYLVLVQKHCEKKSTVETLQLNSINTLPILLSFSLVQMEPVSALQYEHLHDLHFILLFFLVISLGCFLNYTMFLCTSVNSALTTTVVAMLKTVVQTSIGFFAFGGVIINTFTGLGILTNISGGILYTFAKYSEYAAKTLPLKHDKTDFGKNGVSHGAYNYGHVEKAIAVLGKNGYVANGTNSAENQTRNGDVPNRSRTNSGTREP